MTTTPARLWTWEGIAAGLCVADADTPRDWAKRRVDPLRVWDWKLDRRVWAWEHRTHLYRLRQDEECGLLKLVGQASILAALGPPRRGARARNDDTLRRLTGLAKDPLPVEIADGVPWAWACAIEDWLEAQTSAWGGVGGDRVERQEVTC